MDINAMTAKEVENLRNKLGLKEDSSDVKEWIIIIALIAIGLIWGFNLGKSSNQGIGKTNNSDITCNPKSKRALLRTTTTNIISGNSVDRGWQEVIIVEEQGNLIKIKWVDGNQTQWLWSDNSVLIRLD